MLPSPMHLVLLFSIRLSILRFFAISLKILVFRITMVQARLLRAVTSYEERDGKTIHVAIYYVILPQLRNMNANDARASSLASKALHLPPSHPQRPSLLWYRTQRTCTSNHHGKEEEEQAIQGRRQRHLERHRRSGSGSGSRGRPGSSRE